MIYSVLKILTFAFVLCSCVQKSFSLNTCCSTQNSFKNGVCESESEDADFPSDLSVLNKLFVSNRSHAEIQDYLLHLRLSVVKINCPKTSSIEIPLLGDDLESKILQNGDFKYRNKYYDPTQFCIDGLNKQSLHVVLCETNCESTESGSTCLPKCCANGQLLDVTTKPRCVTTNSSNAWKPGLYEGTGRPVSEYIHDTINLYQYPPRGWCSGGGVLMFQKDIGTYTKSPFRILRNGHVVYQVRNQWPTLSPDSYCVDGLLPTMKDGENSAEIEDVIFHCSPAPSTIDGVSTNENPNNETYFQVIICGCFISAFFVLLTITVYVLLWENQNIHGWTLLGSFVSLFFMYILIGTMHLHHLNSGVAIQRNVSACWNIGVALHFFYLSTFTWMTAVNFDLWFTFSNLRPTSSHAGKGLKRFVLYALFALGVPVTIVTVSVSLDYLYRNNIYTDLILPDPNYASEKCFLARKESLIVYQYGPVGVLLFINLLFFVITVLTVHKIQQTTSFAHSNSSNRHKQSLRLFGKLFVIMGFSWAFELISFFFNPSSVPWYWAIFDVINVCHGILIFIIFVCKKSTVKSLRQKYVCFEKLMEAVTRCMSSAVVFQNPNGISRSLTTTFTLNRFTKRHKSSKDSNRKSSDNTTEMSTVSNAA